jgi:hypothetical protein
MDDSGTLPTIKTSAVAEQAATLGMRRQLADLMHEQHKIEQQHQHQADDAAGGYRRLVQLADARDNFQHQAKAKHRVIRPAQRPPQPGIETMRCVGDFDDHRSPRSRQARHSTQGASRRISRRRGAIR